MADAIIRHIKEAYSGCGRCVYILNSSKKVWKSKFDQELLSYLSNNRRMLGIIRKIV